MNQQLVERILQERGENAETAKGYRSAYNKMEDFEQRCNKEFIDDPSQMLVDFINDQAHTNIVALINQLRFAKTYLSECGLSKQVADITGRDFDLSKAMQRSFVDSLEEVYRRNSLVFDPANGDAIFPLSSFAWMGLSLTQALALPDKNVDLEHGVITGASIELVFDHMPADMITVLTQFRNAVISKKNNGQVKFPDRIGLFIYKTSSPGSKSEGKSLSIGTATALFARARDEFNKRNELQITTTYKDITTSARYFAIRQAELAGLDIDSSDSNERLQQCFQTKRLEPGYIRYNYHMYKRAFGLQ